MPKGPGSIFSRVEPFAVLRPCDAFGLLGSRAENDESQRPGRVEAPCGATHGGRGAAGSDGEGVRATRQARRRFFQTFSHLTDSSYPKYPWKVLLYCNSGRRSVASTLAMHDKRAPQTRFASLRSVDDQAHHTQAHTRSSTHEMPSAPTAPRDTILADHAVGPPPQRARRLIQRERQPTREETGGRRERERLL